MIKKTTVTIGIPAYNEEANIKQILLSLLSQNQTTFKIQKIIVISDGSSDNTVKYARTVKNPLIKVLDDKSRKGKGERQNELFKSSISDILVVIDADSLITDINFLEKLIKPISENKADLTAAALTEIPGKTVFEKILNISMEYKKTVFEHFRKGNNLYTCRGVARAFSKRLCKEMKFPFSIGEDAFCFLYCKTHNFSYRYSKEAVCYYKSPDSLVDYQKQSHRYYESQKKLASIFGEKMVIEEFGYSRKTALIFLIYFILKSPLYMILYLFFMVYMKFSFLSSKGMEDLWIMSKSSKLLKKA